MCVCFMLTVTLGSRINLNNECGRITWRSQSELKKGEALRTGKANSLRAFDGCKIYSSVTFCHEVRREIE